MGEAKVGDARSKAQVERVQIRKSRKVHKPSVGDVRAPLGRERLQVHQRSEVLQTTVRNVLVEHELRQRFQLREVLHASQRKVEPHLDPEVLEVELS